MRDGFRGKRLGWLNACSVFFLSLTRLYEIYIYIYICMYFHFYMFTCSYVFRYVLKSFKFRLKQKEKKKGRPLRFAGLDHAEDEKKRGDTSSFGETCRVKETSIGSWFVVVVLLLVLMC